MTIADATPRSLVRIAERQNPKRSFLLVSTVLGKHLPVPGTACRAAGTELARAVAANAPETVGAGTVVGFAETATGLAEQVADGLDASWFATTTRQAGTLRRAVAFDEPHSHAPSQWIAPPPADEANAPLVLVDDELTTGATAANLIRVLHADAPRSRYVLATLVDARASEQDALERCATELGCTVDVVALERLTLGEPAPAGWSGGALPARAAEMPSRREMEARIVTEIEIEHRGPLQHHGQGRMARKALATLAQEAADEVAPLPEGTLVLGTGEHLAFAQRFAASSGALTGSSTRSPVLVSARPGYPIADGLAFANPDDPTVPGYAYNVHAARRPHIVVHFQDRAHRARGDQLLAALVGAGAERVTIVTLGA